MVFFGISTVDLVLMSTLLLVTCKQPFLKKKYGYTHTNLTNCVAVINYTNVPFFSTYIPVLSIWLFNIIWIVIHILLIIGLYILWLVNETVIMNGIYIIWILLVFSIKVLPVIIFEIDNPLFSCSFCLWNTSYSIFLTLLSLWNVYVIGNLYVFFSVLSFSLVSLWNIYLFIVIWMNYPFTFKPAGT